jgi:drug/metabolite transporter (DMT)-like permease
MKPVSGVWLALAAAALFGASTPLAKALLGEIQPILLAGLLYLGSGFGLSLWLGYQKLFQPQRLQEANIPRDDWPWLGGAILAGGVIAPICLLFGLSSTPASSAALLLNLEGVFTALLAWVIFKENTDARIIWGMVAITAGGFLLSWTGRLEGTALVGLLAIVGACLAWGIDNNLTRKVSASDPIQIAAIKGGAAGIINTSLGLALGAQLPPWTSLLLAGLVGFLGYGLSLTLFIIALRQLGTARTGAYFATAPFVGSFLAVLLLHDPITPYFIGAAGLMSLGVWLHLTEHHEHEHVHEELEHEHAHVHDEHHQHAHDTLSEEPHSHSHRHASLVHRHPHYPDIHHRHQHL